MVIRVHSLLKGFDGHAPSPRNLIAAVSTGSARSSGAAAHVVRALSCEFCGLGASALSFQLRGFALPARPCARAKPGVEGGTAVARSLNARRPGRASGCTYWEPLAQHLTSAFCDLPNQVSVRAPFPGDQTKCVVLKPGSDGPQESVCLSQKTGTRPCIF